jgi:hypothetical protein
MGIFSSLKKLLFVTESVAKSATDKGVDLIKEKAVDLSEQAMEAGAKATEVITQKTGGFKDAVIDAAQKGYEKASDLAEEIFDNKEDNSTKSAANTTEESMSTKTAGLGAVIMDKAKGLADDAADLAKEASMKIESGMEKIAETETFKQAVNMSEKVGDKILDAGESVMAKAKEISEDVGTKVISEGGVLAEKAKNLSETIGEKVFVAKDELVEKAKEGMKQFEEKFEALKDKAVAAQAEENAKPKQEFAEKTLDAGKSLLGDDKDDFFSKAEKYAKGQYDAFSDKVEDLGDQLSKASEKGSKLDLPPLDLPSSDDTK